MEELFTITESTDKTRIKTIVLHGDPAEVLEVMRFMSFALEAESRGVEPPKGMLPASSVIEKDWGVTGTLEEKKAKARYALDALEAAESARIESLEEGQSTAPEGEPPKVLH